MIKEIPRKYLMATKASHRGKDVSSDEPDLCFINGEECDDWIGGWVIGLRLMETRFPKATTRELTEAEIKEYEHLCVQIGNGPGIHVTVK